MEAERKVMGRGSGICKWGWKKFRLIVIKAHGENYKQEKVLKVNLKKNLDLKQIMPV